MRLSVAQVLNGGLRKIPAWVVYALGLVSICWLVWLGMTGGLGVEPIKELEHRLGKIALQLLVLVLLISPLRKLFGLNLLGFRRAIGVLAFVFVFLHLLTWAILDLQMQGIWAEIVKRPYITIGMAAFSLMVPLALTSNNLAVRKLGPILWRRVHLLTYPAAVLGGLHYVMLVKTWQTEPLVYLAAIVGLLALRMPILQKRSIGRA